LSSLTSPETISRCGRRWLGRGDRSAQVGGGGGRSAQFEGGGRSAQFEGDGRSAQLDGGGRSMQFDSDGRSKQFNGGGRSKQVSGGRGNGSGELAPFSSLSYLPLGPLQRRAWRSGR
jgi:hypothetical protein